LLIPLGLPLGLPLSPFLNGIRLSGVPPSFIVCSLF
jgi:hypothetical protein